MAPASGTLLASPCATRRREDRHGVERIYQSERPCAELEGASQVQRKPRRPTRTPPPRVCSFDSRKTELDESVTLDDTAVPEGTWNFSISRRSRASPADGERPWQASSFHDIVVAATDSRRRGHPALEEAQRPRRRLNLRAPGRGVIDMHA